jgi:hypothetical protein
MVFPFLLFGFHEALQILKINDQVVAMPLVLKGKAHVFLRRFVSSKASGIIGCSVMSAAMAVMARMRLGSVEVIVLVGCLREGKPALLTTGFSESLH